MRKGGAFLLYIIYNNLSRISKRKNDCIGTGGRIPDALHIERGDSK
jgi:hypothetical protein